MFMMMDWILGSLRWDGVEERREAKKSNPQTLQEPEGHMQGTQGPRSLVK